MPGDGNGFDPIDPGQGYKHRHGHEATGCGCVEVGSIYAVFDPQPV
ncbi:MAG: hypothetical protein V1934_07030 [Methanobacteriota archaeon]